MGGLSPQIRDPPHRPDKTEWGKKAAQLREKLNREESATPQIHHK
jgi:hypothetical protein